MEISYCSDTSLSLLNLTRDTVRSRLRFDLPKEILGTPDKNKRVGLVWLGLGLVWFDLV